MKVISRIDDAFPKKIHEVVQRRVNMKFSRFADIIRDVTITLKDLNGPRGGVDTSCSIVVRLKQAQPVVIEERSDKVKQAFMRAIERAGRTLARQARRRSEDHKPARRRGIALQH